MSELYAGGGYVSCKWNITTTRRSGKTELAHCRALLQSREQPQSTRARTQTRISRWPCGLHNFSRLSVGSRYRGRAFPIRLAISKLLAAEL